MTRLRHRRSALRPFVIDSSIEDSDDSRNAEGSQKSTDKRAVAEEYARDTSPHKRRKLGSPSTPVRGYQDLSELDQNTRNASPPALSSADESLHQAMTIPAGSTDGDDSSGDSSPLRKRTNRSTHRVPIRRLRRFSSISDLTEIETERSEDDETIKTIDPSDVVSMVDAGQDQEVMSIIDWRVCGRFIQYHMQTSQDSTTKVVRWVRADTLPASPWDFKIKSYFRNNPVQYRRFRRTLNHIDGSGMIESNFGFKVYGTECLDRRTITFKVRHEESVIGQNYAELPGPKLHDSFRMPIARYWRERAYDVQHENIRAAFATMDMRSRDRFTIGKTLDLVEDDIAANVVEEDDELEEIEGQELVFDPTLEE